VDTFSPDDLLLRFEQWKLIMHDKNGADNLHLPGIKSSEIIKRVFPFPSKYS
jgi:hypothetical protein